jgi:hypothetical protein
VTAADVSDLRIRWSEPSDTSASQTRRAKRLSYGDRHPDLILWRYQWTQPPRAVDARGVVRKVEVDHDPTALGSQIGTLHRIEQLPIASVACITRCLLSKRKKYAAPVS